jgi:hypothetical protein
LGTQAVQAPEMQAAGQVMSMPSVPVLSHVWSVFMSILHCVEPGTHVPPQSLLVHAKVHVESWNVPVALQVCRVRLSLHCLVPGTHMPPHAAGGPLKQTNWQVEFWNVPVPSQVWSVCTPPHLVAPGVHSPVQLPVWQTNVHVWLPPHVPVASHVCATFGFEGSQRCVVGTQVPVHVPAEQTNGHGDIPPFVQFPLVSHVCG